MSNTYAFIPPAGSPVMAPPVMAPTVTLPASIMPPINIEGVNGFIDTDGTAWLKLEDCARGLGIVEKKGKVEYIRWRTVNDYLKEFDYSSFSQEVAKVQDAFIPEYIFYRLAMKANNAIANAFQDKIARVILPAIRKHGFYANHSANFNAHTLAGAIDEVGLVTQKIRDVFGVENGIALAKATSMVEQFYNLKLDHLKELLPPAEHDVGFLNATQIGKLVGDINSRNVNQILVRLGLQEKIDGIYHLTDLGKNFAELIPFEKNGHSGYQIRWNTSVLELVRKDLENAS